MHTDFATPALTRLNDADAPLDHIEQGMSFGEGPVWDKRNGLLPFFVCATVGTTSTLAMDPLPEIGAICRKHGLWLHVDAAMAGPAALCPEFRSMHKGIELADSYVFDAHKWMFTNFDCSCFWVADRKALI